VKAVLKGAALTLVAWALMMALFMWLRELFGL
jgi:hypothetical protein